ncbi:MAG: cardiolipin synthase B [Verrucomicrobia bacterium]|nr:cardiolipin synthase B [Verrucomicrobiota bacterium]
MHWMLRLLLLFVLLGAGGCSTYQGRPIHAALDQPYAAADARFLHRAGQLLDTTTVPGNQVREYINGDAFFPIMLEAIRSAQHSITLATYIYWRGEAGRQFSEALMERARAGVQVRASLDWIGSRCMDRADLAQLREAGAEVRFYNPFSLLHPFRVNHRDHRKILVVDGRLGFIGGAGIGDVWLGNAHTEKHWRDGFYRVEGPVVAQLQSVFLENWAKITGEIESGDGFFPELAAAGTDSAHVFSNTAGAGTDRVRLFYLLAFDSARENIRIAMAYFIPCKAIRRSLIDAASRGVEVEIIVPNSRNNNQAARHMSRRHYGDLLKAGVRIFEYQPSMYHVKCIIVDDALVSVGSANMDGRTFRYNDEANLNILSPSFAASQIRVFEADKLRAHEITRADWKKRSPLSRLAECLLVPCEPLF